jgi:hypothetical protein
MVVDSGGRIHTIRCMSFSRGSFLATPDARADVPVRAILADRAETLRGCGAISGDAGFSRLRE